jgi:hypothetical protein
MSNWEMVVRLLLAAMLGSIIGAERGRLQWAAEPSHAYTRLRRILLDHVIMRLDFETIEAPMGMDLALRLRRFVIEPAPDALYDEITLSFSRSRARKQRLLELAQKLEARSGVSSVSL